jgi:hypothetical protein
MSDLRSSDPVFLNAVRQLAAEARHAAAALELHVPEHEFYAGVEHAAERRLRPGLAAIEPPDIEHWPPAFREGYLQASSQIALAATGPSPLHVPLPRFRIHPEASSPIEQRGR